MDTSTHVQRRQALRKAVQDGAILFLGLEEAPRNYPANPYPFRQDSHFLYYVGTNLPGMAALLLPDGDEILFGAPEDPDDLVWHGPHPVLADHAAAAGFAKAATTSELPAAIEDLAKRGVKIHYLPPYRAERCIHLGGLLDVHPTQVAAGASQELARAVVEQRSIKTPAEVAEIEEALRVSFEMYQAAFRVTEAGRRESEVAGAMQGVALMYDRAQSFPPIVSVRGEVLHNTSRGNILEDGQLLLIDSGTESPGFYASDITRTIPVSGHYSDEQRLIYQIVLDAELAVIAAASPEVSNRDLHMIAASTIARGLTAAGLMKGDPDEAVAAGAHALFFPHGIGHMVGLDVHDMEDLGDVVGYPEGEPRSKQFGLAFLRLAKKLRPGFVITDEPGVYFVPALIDRWAAEKKHEAFIDYDAVRKFVGFGGVRIEDDLLITEDGCRVLGQGIPKEISDIEEAMRIS